MSDTERNHQPLDAILRRAMRERPGPATPECADPESLAAYWDKSMAAAERERIEAHLADCARCQMQLATIARAQESASDASAAAKVAWYRRWPVAIPALAAVAAVLVFFAIRRPANVELPSDQVVAMAKREAPAMELPAPAPEPASPFAAPAAVPAAKPASPRAAPASNEIAMNVPRSVAAPRPQVKSTEAQRASENAAAPEARAMTAQAGAAPANVGAPVSGGAAVAGAAAGSLGPRAAKTFVTISPPDQSVRWIAGKHGLVWWRRADGRGHVQHSGVSTDLVAGAAPSATVCWIVGRAGTIIRTTDGEHWAVVTAPTSDDLVAVSATSAGDATIMTAGGRSFTTSDGGASWHPQ